MDEQDGIMMYNGLESRIINSYSYDNESGTSRADGCPTGSFDEDALSCSSRKDAFGSFSSQLLMKGEEHALCGWELSKSPQHFYARDKTVYLPQFSDVEIMKERFAKLLLGEDISGGCSGHSTALALSNAVINLAASVFGELWKLEPLSEERKSMWRTEMEWLISPTNYMVELIPTKQNGASGGALEIMAPKARSDIQMNLPALRKLDSMLLETLDSMVNVEFWYVEGGSRAEGRSRRTVHSMKWWLPSPRVHNSGLSILERQKLVFRGNFVQQVLKATKVINQNILLEMPIPTVIGDALPKSARTSLGVDLYRAITMGTRSIEEILHSLHLETEHRILETVNGLEAAIFIWKQRIAGQGNEKSPARNSWSFVRDLESEFDKIEEWSERAEALRQLVKIRFPNLPQSFLDVTKVQYNKDVGHSILEAYSRVLGSLAFRILSRIRDILQEDDLIKANSPIYTSSFLCFPNQGHETLASRTRYSLIDQMSIVDGRICSSSVSRASNEFSDSEARTSTTATPCSKRS